MKRTSKEIHPGFETQGRYYHKYKAGLWVAPQKGMMSSKTFIYKQNDILTMGHPMVNIALSSLVNPDGNQRTQHLSQQPGFEPSPCEPRKYTSSSPTVESNRFPPPPPLSPSLISPSSPSSSTTYSRTSIERSLFRLVYTYHQRFCERKWFSMTSSVNSTITLNWTQFKTVQKRWHLRYV